jgi:diguanylate cyclase (GGDEF)-like protein
MKIHVVDKIQKVNHQLTSITNGNLNQVVDVRNIHEFSELSTHINRMVQNLLSSNAKLTYIFSKNNFFVGTYEYAQDSNSIQFSEYIPVLFNVDESTVNNFAGNPSQFKEFLKGLEAHAIPNEKNVYEIGRRYVRIDEIVDKNYVLGVVIDVTDDVAKRQKLAFEINLDSLTGLFNPSGFEEHLSKLFDTPEKLGYYACFTIMLDNLISINDMYGRNNGDRYIQEIAKLISDFGIKESLASRKGGGEFILFIYGYETETELSKAISLLSYIQHHSVAHLDNGTDIPIDFSFGYSVYNVSDSIGYEQLLKESNEKTFNNISV